MNRVVRETGGLWEVVHPFTGRVEFSSPERGFAEAVRDEFDKRDPLSVDWLVEELYKLHPSVRFRSEWVVSSATMAIVRKLKDPAGRYLFEPALVVGDLDHILGRPIAYDETAVGISLRVAP